MLQTPQAPPAAVPAPPSAPVQPGASIELLQAHEIDLVSAVARMEAERSVLSQQASSRVAAVRVPAQTQLASLDLQLAGARADLAVTQERLRTQHVQPMNTPPRQGTLLAPQDYDRMRRRDAQQTAMTIVFILAVLMPLSVAIARRILRRPQPRPEQSSPDMTMRFDRLENAVETIAVEVERISENQRFMTKVMTERPARAEGQVVQPQAKPESASPAVPDARPFRALGAGSAEPAQPIRVAERQPVRPVNTPH